MTKTITEIPFVVSNISHLQIIIDKMNIRDYEFVNHNGFICVNLAGDDEDALYAMLVGLSTDNLQQQVEDLKVAWKQKTKDYYIT